MLVTFALKRISLRAHEVAHSGCTHDVSCMTECLKRVLAVVISHARFANATERDNFNCKKKKQTRFTFCSYYVKLLFFLVVEQTNKLTGNLQERFVVGK